MAVLLPTDWLRCSWGLSGLGFGARPVAGVGGWCAEAEHAFADAAGVAWRRHANPLDVDPTATADRLAFATARGFVIARRPDAWPDMPASPAGHPHDVDLSLPMAWGLDVLRRELSWRDRGAMSGRQFENIVSEAERCAKAIDAALSAARLGGMAAYADPHVDRARARLAMALKSVSPVFSLADLATRKSEAVNPMPVHRLVRRGHVA